MIGTGVLEFPQQVIEEDGKKIYSKTIVCSTQWQLVLGILKFGNSALVLSA